MFFTDFSQEPNSPACWMKWIFGISLLLLQLSILWTVLWLHITLGSTLMFLPLVLLNLIIKNIFRLLSDTNNELDIHIVFAIYWSFSYYWTNYNCHLIGLVYFKYATRFPLEIFISCPSSLSALCLCQEFVLHVNKFIMLGTWELLPIP